MASSRPNGWSLLPRWARKAAFVLMLTLLVLAFVFPIIAVVPVGFPERVEGVHHFLLFVSALLLTVFAFWATVLDSRGKRRRKVGRCPRCNYDVRATPVADGPSLSTCPECGQSL